MTVVSEHVIRLADGTRLAARSWLPDDVATPVPAVLEYLPYRLGDGTAASDHAQMGYFAGRGYAGVRVDIRGTGSSTGLCRDEYAAQEQADCLEVIDWIAAQPWCSGAVGMMGYSWSGFNCLQVAAHRPPALKAIASCYASDDRYADDVHYRGGLVIPMDMLHWSVTMHGWQARPPDPLVLGDGWRAEWLARLELEPWIAHWLAHQHRDAYWRQGSVRDEPARIACPVMCVGGWTDGYSDSALRLMELLEVPCRALIGPWGHNDPESGNPGPPAGVNAELVRFWDRWLKGIDPIDGEPIVMAYVQESVRPQANRELRPGRWIGEPEWPSPRIGERLWSLGDGTLGDSPSPGYRSIGSVQTVGLDGGAWCADGRSADLPLDQRAEDARSLTFTSEPLDVPLEMLGFAEARLSLRADRPAALVSARLCEVREDGSSLLVTRGQLNLCHRRSHADPQAVVPGEQMAVTVRMDAIGHRFAAGSRLRLSLSPCYWPLAWPSPEPVTLTVAHGAGSALALPVRTPGADEPSVRAPDAPSIGAAAFPSEHLHDGSGGGRAITRDLASGRTTLVFDWDCGGLDRMPNGMLYEDTSVATYTICDDDPLSARVEVITTIRSGRDGWRVDGTATGVMTCTAGEFIVISRLEVDEDGERIFEREWMHRFPRDHC